MLEQTVAAGHESFMRACIALALVARQRGDSPAGSVIVQDGKIIGEGIEGGKTHQDISFHAEMEAIRQATAYLQSQDLSACIMYTTHQPCIMCSYMIRHTKISMVAAGITTGEIGGYSSHLPLLADNGIKRWAAPPVFISGILEQECRALHTWQ